MLTDIQKGDILFVDFGIENRRGSEQKGQRPVICTSNEPNNLFAPTINVVPLTSQLSKAKIPVHVFVGIECGIKYPSIALCEQETTIDKSRIMSRYGHCTEKIMEELETAIKKQRDIKEKDQQVFVELFDINKFNRLKRGAEELYNFMIRSGNTDIPELQMSLSLQLLELSEYCKKYNQQKLLNKVAAYDMFLNKGVGEYGRKQIYAIQG
jgi:mRNA interferase MazF